MKNLLYNHNLFQFGLWLQGLSIFNSEHLLIGISLSSLEKAFSVVDIGPNAENKEEVYVYLFGIMCQFLCERIYLSFLCNRLSSLGSFGGKRQSLEDIKMVKLQKAQVRCMLLSASVSCIWFCHDDWSFFF